MRDAWDAAAPPLPPHACVAQLFGAPSRALQAPLLPLLRRLDAARAAGGRVAFVHARTYAVDAKMTAPETMVVMEAAAVASRGDTVLPETCGAGGRESRGWAAFNDEAAECGACAASRLDITARRNAPDDAPSQHFSLGSDTCCCALFRRAPRLRFSPAPQTAQLRAVRFRARRGARRDGHAWRLLRRRLRLRRPTT